MMQSLKPGPWKVPRFDFSAWRRATRHCEPDRLRCKVSLVKQASSDASKASASSLLKRLGRFLDCVFFGPKQASSDASSRAENFGTLGRHPRMPKQTHLFPKALGQSPVCIFIRANVKGRLFDTKADSLPNAWRNPKTALAPFGRRATPLAEQAASRQRSLAGVCRFWRFSV